MDLPITLRQERRAVPRFALLLQQAPLDLAANPALLADLQAAVATAKRDPRAVNCFLQGHKLNLDYAMYLLQMAEEAQQQRAVPAEVAAAVTELQCGNGDEQCLPAKQDQQ